MEQGRRNWITDAVTAITDEVPGVHNRRSLVAGDADQCHSNIRRGGGDRLGRRPPLFGALSTDWSCR